MSPTSELIDFPSKTPVTEPLPPGQARVLAAIWHHWAEHGESPTYRDLMTALNIKSPNGINCHIEPLVKKGYLEELTGMESRQFYPVQVREAIRTAIRILMETQQD